MSTTCSMAPQPPCHSPGAKGVQGPLEVIPCLFQPAGRVLGTYFWVALAPASLTLPYSMTPLFGALKNIAPHSDLDGALWPGTH